MGSVTPGRTVLLGVLPLFTSLFNGQSILAILHSRAGRPSASSYVGRSCLTITSIFHDYL